MQAGHSRFIYGKAFLHQVSDGEAMIPIKSNMRSMWYRNYTKKTEMIIGEAKWTGSIIIRAVKSRLDETSMIKC